MNTNMPPAHAVAAHKSGQPHHALWPSAGTVRAALAYLALWVFATLMAAACVAHWRVFFV